tara:strand:+ start:399 stop:689 length:291 start_codon:yes stop_codon:yes gene_type:complete
MKRILISLFAGLFLFSCTDVKELTDAVKKVGDEQKLIVQKLNRIEKKLNEAPKAAPSKNDKPKSDPNKVYNIADAGSVILGNPKAPITVVKWTDFQ